MVVWTSLPAEVRQDLGGEPVAFMENRHRVMEALERAGWPVKERDIVLLENEIKLGVSYIKQVSSLLNSVKFCQFHQKESTFPPLPLSVRTFNYIFVVYCTHKNLL